MEPFDPLAVENVGVILADELFEQPVQTFPLGSSFPGAGIYTIYYRGRESAYKALVKLDAGRSLYPIYIGSAVRESSKQGFTAKATTEARIHSRLLSHQRSIESAGLDIRDFSYRYLRLNDAYVTLAESVLITVFRPAWNGMGLGSNGVGGPRMNGRASLWDAIHPGRPGRPAGDQERRREAEAYVASSIERIGSDYDDARTQRMAERIMRFVQARRLPSP